MPTILINRMLIRAAWGRSAELAVALEPILQALAQAPGCLGYVVHCSSQDQHLWQVTGQWSSEAALQAHFAHPAAQGLMQLLQQRLVSALEFQH